VLQILVQRATSKLLKLQANLAILKDPKSGASANSATFAALKKLYSGL